MELNTSSQTSSTTLQTNMAQYTTNQNTSKAKTDSNQNKATSTETDGYVSSKETEVNGLYSKPKKLTSDQIQALKDAQTESKKQMLQEMTNGLLIGQGATATVSNPLQDLFSKLNMDLKLPDLETDPEKAAAALKDDGPYSINSVATRIMDMAKALAGDDSDKLITMRSAVEKGFSEAGVKFTTVTGKDSLPQICKDTYTEVMKRFDDLEKKDDVEEDPSDKTESTDTTTNKDTEKDI